MEVVFLPKCSGAGLAVELVRCVEGVEREHLRRLAEIATGIER